MRIQTLVSYNYISLYIYNRIYVNIDFATEAY